MPIKPAQKPKNIPCACGPSSMVSLHLMAPDSLRQSSAMHIRIRPNFPGLGRGLFRAISSGFWPKKFFSSDFLRQLAQKVFFKRFPQAFGPKSFFRAISSGFWPKKFFSSDFLRQLAEKVFFERFPQAFGPKSFKRFPQAIISNAHPHPAKFPRPRQRPFAAPGSDRRISSLSF